MYKSRLDMPYFRREQPSVGSVPNRQGFLSIFIDHSFFLSIASLPISFGHTSPGQLTADLLPSLSEGHNHSHTGGYGSVEQTIQLGEGHRIPPHQYDTSTSVHRIASIISYPSSIAVLVD